MASPSQTPTPAQIEAIFNGPAITPPAGEMSNLVDPPNLIPIVALVISFAVGLTTLAILLRAYTKLFLIKTLAYEDHTILLAWIGQIAETVSAGLTSHYGAGVHEWNVRLKDMVQVLYWLNVSSIVYNPAILFIKLSILLQYLRVFRPTSHGNKLLYWGVHLSIWACTVFYATTTLTSIITCIPRQRIWNPWITEGFCIDYAKGFQATGVFNIVSDFLILLLPIPTVLGLKMPSSKKLGIIAVFSAGLFACLASIGRAIFVWNVTTEVDFSFAICKVGFWTQAEISIGIVVACLPVAPRFFQSFGPTMRRFLPFLSRLEAADELQYSHKLSQGDTKMSIKAQRQFSTKNTPEAWGDPHSVRTQPTSKHSVSANTSPQRAETKEVYEPSSRPSSVQKNLEAGHTGIRVEQTIEVERTPRDTPMTSLELARVRRDRAWLLV